MEVHVIETADKHDISYNITWRYTQIAIFILDAVARNYYNNISNLITVYLSMANRLSTAYSQPYVRMVPDSALC